MVNEDSPVKQFYPVEFETDLNGKQQEWEAVVLIPFIDEPLLVQAMETCTASLTEEVRLSFSVSNEVMMSHCWCVL